jgi:hypothetical protein
MLRVNAVAMLSRRAGRCLSRVEQPSSAIGKTSEAAVSIVSTIFPYS